jgi:hypothetical protein
VRQEASEVARAAAPHPKTVRRCELPRELRRGVLREEATRERTVCTGKTEARTTPSSVGESGLDRRKAVWRNAGLSNHELSSRRLRGGGRRGRGGTHSGESRRARQSGDGTDARVERRLQKLARGIFLVPPRSPRGGRGGLRVARRGGRPMTGQVERAGRKGAGYCSAWTFTGKHDNAHSAARSRIESAEGAPVSCAASSLAGGSRAGAWRSGIVALPDERRVRRANAGTEPLRERPRSDRERQRWRRRVRPPQSKGAGGLQPTTAARCEERHVRSSRGTQSSCARCSATEAVTAKNRDTERWDRQRELRDPSAGTGGSRRCHVVSQARRGGSPRPKRPQRDAAPPGRPG